MILAALMFEVPLHEIASPEEQIAVARCVAIMASRDRQVSDAERRFVEELMGSMMLLPEERDAIRREFVEPGDILAVAAAVKNREARIFLLYQAISAAFADNDLVEDEFQVVLELAELFDFDQDAARAFVFWVRDSLELRERGQQLVMEL